MYSAYAETCAVVAENMRHTRDVRSSTEKGTRVFESTTPSFHGSVAAPSCHRSRVHSHSHARTSMEQVADLDDEDA